MASRKQQKAERREAHLAAQARARAGARRRRRGLVLSLAAAGGALIALVAVLVVVNSGGSAPKVTAGDPVLGRANAPVTIVEYGDYKCPICTAWAIQTEPQLKRAYIDTGKVRLVWHDFTVIDAESEPAAQAARCAGVQGRYWAYHDALYHYTWNTFYARNDSAEGQAAFTGHYDQLARRAGVKDIAAFSACRMAGSYRNAVNQSRADGVNRGVDGTPTFFIDGQKVVGGQPYDVFRRLLDAKLGGS